MTTRRHRAGHSVTLQAFPGFSGNDPWDHDAICWLLTQLGPTTTWTYGILFECARKQPNRMLNDLDRVLEAARVCGRFDVEQLAVLDPTLGKRVTRLRRNDPKKPEYPSYYDQPSKPDNDRMTITAAHKAAAELLLDLLGAYEAELVAAGKSRSTINTYVDRAERFLKRILGG